RLWSVTAETGFGRRPGLRGLVVYRVKRVLHKLMRWYVEPFAAMQREFNLTTLRLVDELGAELTKRSGPAMLTELDERLTRLERRLRESPEGLPVSGQVAAAAPTPSSMPTPMPDYFAFESRMRGSTDLVRERQALYVEDFREAAPVLDVGCGRGEFLRLLAETGVEARGIDLDADMVAYARGEGLDVQQAEALSYLDGLPDAELGGIFCAHVVEHLELPALVRLLELSAVKLREGGLFIAETPNPQTLIALSTFFADLTHVRPVHPETLALLARQVGFASTEIRYLNLPEPEGRLQRVPDQEVLDENFERLNEVVFGPQDFALVART
ncbi:MAG: class I SAM-dependent methyltransferase, partial [Gaiellales bacterium]